MKMLNTEAGDMNEVKGQEFDVSRRRFLQLAGVIGGAGLVFSACRPKTRTSDVYIGSGDTALLNYLYILQQIEAAFYTQSFATPYYGLTVSENELLKNVRDQEVAHREFLKALLGKDAIPAISVNFSNVTFAERTNVLSHAIIFEDMVISGMNGVIRLFENRDYIITISKMVTVEARHSAYFRNIRDFNTFAAADVVDAEGLDRAASPAVVMEQAKNYIQTRFDTSRLPNY